MRTDWPHRSLILSTLIALLIAAPGCGRNAAPSAPVAGSQVSAQAADDIARHFASTLARGGVPLSQVGSTNLMSIARSQQLGVASKTGAQIQDEGSFSWSFSLTFFDAAGNPGPYDPETTARMRVIARARGHLTSAEHSASIGVDRLLDVSGLLPAETTIEVDGAANDTADCAFEASDGSAERRYHLLGRGALTDVRQLKDESVNPYPLSGTARWDVSADAFERQGEETAEAHYQATVIVTFNGTRYPTIEVSESYRYRTDLETGEVVRLPA